MGPQPWQNGAHDCSTLTRAMGATSGSRRGQPVAHMVKVYLTESVADNTTDLTWAKWVPRYHACIDVGLIDTQ